MPSILLELGPTFYALVQVALIAFTVIMIWNRRRAFHGGYFILTSLGAFLLVFALSPVFTHQRIPIQLYLVAPIASAVTLFAIRPPWLAKLIFLCMIAFSFAFLALARESRNRDVANSFGQQISPESRLRMALSDAADRIRLMAPELYGSKTKLAAGWVSDPPYSEFVNSVWIEDLERRKQIYCWHTWLTGLYVYERTPLNVWSPGGTPEQAAKVELRERPTQ